MHRLKSQWIRVLLVTVITAVLSVGCTRYNATTGQEEIDPGATAGVAGLALGAAALGVALSNNDDDRHYYGGGYYGGGGHNTVNVNKNVNINNNYRKNNNRVNVYGGRGNNRPYHGNNRHNGGNWGNGNRRNPGGNRGGRRHR